MHDATEIFLEFREAVRILWNTSFRGKIAEEHISRSVWHFRKIEARLFNALVLEKLGCFLEVQDAVADYPKYFKVVPLAPEGVHILIQRSHQDSGYWDNSISRTEKLTDLRFISFFDWDELGFIDAAYCRAKIYSFGDKSELEGLDALISVADVKIYFLGEG